jgi:hypothetical protein
MIFGIDATGKEIDEARLRAERSVSVLQAEGVRLTAVGSDVLAMALEQIEINKIRAAAKAAGIDPIKALAAERAFQEMLAADKSPVKVI